MRDYDEKFEHSLPMPVVSDKHLTFTLEGSKLYLAILVQIATMFEDLTLHYDNPDMVRLVVDHMQIFERHWRKMVQDIRKGTLHVHVSVAPEARELYENTRLPKVQRNISTLYFLPSFAIVWCPCDIRSPHYSPSLLTSSSSYGPQARNRRAAGRDI